MQIIIYENKMFDFDPLKSWLLKLEKLTGAKISLRIVNLKLFAYFQHDTTSKRNSKEISILAMTC